jgi:hypothetical protein
MQIIRNVAQGSDEWLKLRLGIATASNFSKIVTSKGEASDSAKKYALELVSEILAVEQDPRYKSFNMELGNEVEPEAREAYQEATFNAIEEVTFIKSKCGDFGYSPDGLIDEDGLIEIKCPNQITHTKYLLEDRLPVEYVQQVQGGLFVSRRKWCDFVSYHPNFIEEKRLFVKRVYRDEEFIKKLEIGIKKVIAMRNEFLKKING